MLEWYVIRTKSHEEFKARLHYERQGYDVYLPLIRKVVRHARRKTEVLRPFFPGYLFLHLDGSTADWVAISSTYEAIGPVRFGDRIVPVPEWVIEDLKQRECDGAILLDRVPQERLVPGAAIGVKVSDDLVASGIVYSAKGSSNIIALIELMGRVIKATVPLDRICPPNPNQSLTSS